MSDMLSNPTGLESSPKKPGSTLGCFIKGCGCLLILIFLAVGGCVATFYYGSQSLVSNINVGSIVNTSYHSVLRPALIDELKNLSPEQKADVLAKADKAVIAFEKLPNEQQIVLLKEVITFATNQSAGKITPPDEIPNLGKFLRDNQLMPEELQAY